MDSKHRTDLIWQLLMEKHSRFCVSKSERHLASSLIKKPEGIFSKFDFEAARAYQNVLNLQTDLELEQLVYELTERRYLLYEEQHPFNQPTAKATVELYEHWSRAEYWTIPEATTLINERNPEAISEHDIRSDRTDGKTALKLKATITLLDRAVYSGALYKSNSPKEYIEWLELKNIDMPDKLKELSLLRCATAHTVKSENLRLKEKIDDLEKQLAGLSAKAEPNSSEKVLGQRERDSLLKLVLGMAVACYAYDPKASRSKEVSEIVSDIEKLGLSIDPDTVRKYLNEAKAQFSVVPNRTE